MYTYAAYHRPVRGFGHVPAGAIAYGEHPDFKHGTVSYDAPLSLQEQRRWSLVDVSRTPEEIAREIADEMSEYGEEYTRLAEEDPRNFKMTVGQRIEQLNVHADRDRIAPLVLRYLKGESAPSPTVVSPVAISPSAPPAPSLSVPAKQRVRHARKADRFQIDKTWTNLGDSSTSVLYAKDHNGGTWDVTANREGRWRIRTAPLQYSDDDRRYAEGQIEDESLNPRELLTAAKRAARAHLAELLEQISKEER